MDVSQLQQLIAMDEQGTLTDAARIAHITQSALTRSIQRLESELGCELFDRKTKPLEFNEAGKIVLSSARQISLIHEHMRESLANLKAKESALRIASVAPAPTWNLTAQIMEVAPGTIVYPELVEANTVETMVVEHQADFGIAIRPSMLSEIVNVSLMSEHLFLLAPENSTYANKEFVSWQDINGNEFLLLEDIGFWRRVVEENLPESNFQTIADQQVFTELMTHSDLLCFTSDAPQNWRDVPSRMRIPVKESDAYVTFFLLTRRNAADVVQAVRKHIDS